MLSLTAAERDFLLTATEREVVARLEIVDRSTNQTVFVIDDRPGMSTGTAQLLPGGSVKIDTAAEVLRTANLSIADPDSNLLVGVDALIGPARRFKLFKGYNVPAQGDCTLWPLGVFELSAEPQIDPASSVRTIRLTLADKSSNANRRPRGGFKNALVASQGLTKLQAIQAIAAVETWQETQFNLWPGSTAALTYDLPWEDNRAPWEAVQQVNSIVEPDGAITRLYYDPYGRLTMIADPGPNLDTLPAVWTAKPTPDGLSQLVNASKSLDLFKLANAVQVKWGSQLVTPGVAWSIDQDPNSPVSVDKIGWLIWTWKGGSQDELIRNATEGQARADFERRRLRSFEEKVPFTIIENPALEPWDVAHIEEPLADVNGNYQLLSATISLDNNLAMACEGWRVRSLGA